jgi:hypothetical protein
MSEITAEDIQKVREALAESAASGSHGTWELNPEIAHVLANEKFEGMTLTRCEDGDRDGLVAYKFTTLRRCTVCGADVGADRPDACLGTLPGVIEACCGHGEPRKAYITFDTGLIIRGFRVQKRPNHWGERVA